MPIPDSRVRLLTDAPLRPQGGFVLYWMTTARRLRSNFALQRAVELASALRRPLVILEALRCDYPAASDRLHQFVLDGMRQHQKDTAGRRSLLYYPYVEPSRGHGRGLLAALACESCAVVTDHYPAYFLPHMTASAQRQVDVRFEAVDSNGLIPLAEHKQAFTVARSYRAFVQRAFRDHARQVPDESPLRALRPSTPIARLPRAISRRWPAATPRMLRGGVSALSALPLDHSVVPVTTRGGSDAAARALRMFITKRLPHYAALHNNPDDDCTSHLSPWLHFGHVSAHQVFSAVATSERWTTRRLAVRGGGAREGWWGMSASAEAFLDQLVVWRELAFNGCEYIPRYSDYDTLPAWSRATLEKHLRDRRQHLYSRDRLESATTDDEVWNAAQRQMVTEGWFHGYLRMLWGKKILEWSRHPVDALQTMEALMNRYSLDGRDPNSWAGYMWVLGRYDRPWPERPVFGTVRYMTSASARRKLRMKEYLRKWQGPPFTISQGSCLEAPP